MYCRLPNTKCILNHTESNTYQGCCGFCLCSYLVGWTNIYWVFYVYQFTWIWQQILLCVVYILSNSKISATEKVVGAEPKDYKCDLRMQSLTWHSGMQYMPRCFLYEKSPIDFSHRPYRNSAAVLLMGGQVISKHADQGLTSWEADLHPPSPTITQGHH